MNKIQKKRLKRIIHAAIYYAAAIILGKSALSSGETAGKILFVAAYIVVGFDTLKKAAGNIKRGKVFDENFLMAIATLGAFAVGEFPEAVAVMLFYEIGELFQSIAVDKSRKSISDLMDIRPDYANIRLPDGGERRTDPYDVEIGSIIIVRPGEKIPLDGEVISGEARLDTAALTGEPVPRRAAAGDKVLSGFINTNSVLEIRVEKEFSDSTVSRILELVEDASSKKSDSENFITRFAEVYTPIVVIAAALIAFIPPVFAGNLSEWVYRALTFLVVSCPCALVISVPLSFFGGIGAASRTGILVKGSNYLEAMADCSQVVLDKTGTLTEGIFEVIHKKAVGINEEELLRIAAAAESHSSHPIAASIKRAYGKTIEKADISGLEEISGRGLSLKLNGDDILLGSAALMQEKSIDFIRETESGTAVHLAVNGVYSGYIVIADRLKQDSFAAVKRLRAAGVKKLFMLTGDNESTAAEVANELGLDGYYAQLLPEDKVIKLEELMKDKSGRLIFVGDGINDAPVLARADIGIAMGGLGSDAAIEAADIVIMNDEPSKIATAIRLAKRTIGIAKQNVVFALGVKASVLLLAALGLSTMWWAVFADVGVAVLAILNSMRNLKPGNIEKY